MRIQDIHTMKTILTPPNYVRVYRVTLAYWRDITCGGSNRIQRSGVGTDPYLMKGTSRVVWCRLLSDTRNYCQWWQVVPTTLENHSTLWHRKQTTYRWHSQLWHLWDTSWIYVVSFIKQGQRRRVGEETGSNVGDKKTVPHSCGNPTPKQTFSPKIKDVLNRANVLIW